MSTKAPYDFGVILATIAHDGSRKFEELTHEDARTAKHAILSGKHPEIKAFKVFSASGRRSDWISKLDAPAESQEVEKAE